MEAAAATTRAIAIDLPGIGESTGTATDGSKGQLADLVHDFVSTAGLEGLTLVGQDVGGMITYAYLRRHQDLARAVIMDVVIPGLDPWDEVLRNPYVWHFAFHTIKSLPERLVQGRQAEYFDFFYNVLAADPAKITADARAAYVRAYASDDALHAGFEWYRTLSRDAQDNLSSVYSSQVATPLLYLRGEKETGRIDDYVASLRAAGIAQVQSNLVPMAGHFPQEEAPEATWKLIADFAQAT